MLTQKRTNSVLGCLLLAFKIRAKESLFSVSILLPNPALAICRWPMPWGHSLEGKKSTNHSSMESSGKASLGHESPFQDKLCWTHSPAGSGHKEDRTGHSSQQLICNLKSSIYVLLSWQMQERWTHAGHTAQWIRLLVPSTMAVVSSHSYITAGPLAT